jgi:hypothetical protein
MELARSFEDREFTEAYRLVADLVGGAAILIWGKLKNWVQETRTSQNHELLFEWFQWLVERLEDRGENVRDPAYQAYRDWREPG